MSVIIGNSVAAQRMGRNAPSGSAPPANTGGGTVGIGDVSQYVTPTSYEPVGPIASTQFARYGASVFYANLTGLDGSAGGMILKIGSTSLGGYAGFRANGDFIWRVGIGSNPPNAKTAYVLVSGGAATIAGDGQIVLAVEIVSSGIWRARAWWGGVEVGTPVQNTVSKTPWCGTTAAAFMQDATNGVPNGEIATAVPVTSTSGLWVCNNQTLPF